MGVGRGRRKRRQQEAGHSALSPSLFAPVSGLGLQSVEPQAQDPVAVPWMYTRGAGWPWLQEPRASKRGERRADAFQEQGQPCPPPAPKQDPSCPETFWCEEIIYSLDKSLLSSLLLPSFQHCSHFSLFPFLTTQDFQQSAFTLSYVWLLSGFSFDALPFLASLLSTSV